MLERLAYSAFLSFNGNKPVTTGGGGMIITNDEKLAAKAKHLTTTAKMPHPWEFVHDMVGYNYRMPNINAAVGCAQMERFADVLANKRATAHKYKNFFDEIGVSFVVEPVDCLVQLLVEFHYFKRQYRNGISFLPTRRITGVQARPVWTLMNKLPMFSQCQNAPIDVAQWLEDRLVNIPSSVQLRR